MRDVTVPGGPSKALAHYLLFAPPTATGQAGSGETRLLVQLAMHYLGGDAAAGFNVKEAKAAAQVTIVGDRFPASTESQLAASGCQVTRLSGDGYEIARALAHLFAEG